jgi:hypothetical protein
MPHSWDVAPYSLAVIDRCFGGIYCLQLHGDELSLMMDGVSTSETSAISDKLHGQTSQMFVIFVLFSIIPILPEYIARINIVTYSRVLFSMELYCTQNSIHIC